MGERAVGWEVNGLRESKWKDCIWGSLGKQWRHRKGKRGKCYLLAKTNEKKNQERKKKRMACSIGKESEGDNERETIGGVKLCGWDNY